jgi:hypothetical protein
MLSDDHAGQPITVAFQSWNDPALTFSPFANHRNIKPSVCQVWSVFRRFVQLLDVFRGGTPGLLGTVNAGRY